MSYFFRLVNPSLKKTLLLALTPCLLNAHSSTPNNTKQEKEHRFGATVDFLYWEASEQGLEYAVEVSTNAQFQPKKMHWKHPHFEWDPGFRLGFSYFLRDHQWDISLMWTRLNTKSTSHASMNSSHFLEQLWTPSPYGIDARKASAKWHLDYNTIDFLLSSPYKMNPHFIFTPAFGLRGLFINQDFKVKYAGGDFDADDPITLHAKNNYHAIGLHLDLGLQFCFNKHWNLFGHGTGTLLYGRFHVPERVSGENVLINFRSSHLFREQRNFYEVCNDLGAGIGLQWKPVLSKKCDFYLSFAYEIIKVFEQNQMRRYRDQNPENPQNTDLGIQGITLTADLKW